jgi:hypothetical protein
MRSTVLLVCVLALMAGPAAAGPKRVARSVARASYINNATVALAASTCLCAVTPCLDRDMVLNCGGTLELPGQRAIATKARLTEVLPVSITNTQTGCEVCGCNDDPGAAAEIFAQVRCLNTGPLRPAIRVQPETRRSRR